MESDPDCVLFGRVLMTIYRQGSSIVRLDELRVFLLESSICPSQVGSSTFQVSSAVPLRKVIMDTLFDKPAQRTGLVAAMRSLLNAECETVQENDSVQSLGALVKKSLQKKCKNIKNYRKKLCLKDLKGLKGTNLKSLQPRA